MDLKTSDEAGINAYKKGDYNKMLEAYKRSVEISQRLYGKKNNGTGYKPYGFNC